MRNLSNAEVKALMLRYSACPPAMAWLEQHADLDLRGLVIACDNNSWVWWIVERASSVGLTVHEVLAINDSYQKQDRLGNEAVNAHVKAYHDDLITSLQAEKLILDTRAHYDMQWRNFILSTIVDDKEVLP